MATEVSTCTTSEICRDCPVVKTIPGTDKFYGCTLAVLEKKLGRIPTAWDVWDWGKNYNLSKIPTRCPNGYHSPENLPLR